MQNNSNNESISPLLNTELLEEEFKISPEQKSELSNLYKDVLGNFQTGKIIKGKIISKEGSSILININYKSDGLIPNHEFSEIELKKLNLGDEIEVILDKIEDEYGNVVLSYEKAKSIKAWEKIAKLAQTDEPVRGVVTHKVKGGLSVDIGIPAFLPGSQVDTQRITEFDQFVGQELICKILKVNQKRGNVILSRRKYLEEQRLEDKKHALETITEDQVLEGIVKNITSYGVFVDIGGIDGLLHITDMSWGRISHPSELVKIGDKITVKVISFDKQHEKISLGTKQLTTNPWEEIDKKYPAGSTAKGRISSITDYGLFVEIEKGVEGLVHISEISWTERINNLSKYYQVGDTIEVKVVDLDKENRRMSLSIKQLMEDPWKKVEEKFKVGEKISGKITNITDFGLFVQLLEGVDGLVHISDISWTNHINHPSEKYTKGNIVDAAILSIDVANKKVSLGIKQLDKDPWENIEEQYPVGTTVEGTVSKITNFGAFIKLPTGIEGLVHISELSNKDISKVEDILKVDQKEKFKIIKVSEEERKLGLSLKALEKEKTPSKEETKEIPKEKTPSKEKQDKTIIKENHEKKEKKITKPKIKEFNKTKKNSPVKGILQQALEAHAEKIKKEKEKKNNSE
ncbi:30S ribosomal protein S1 [Candidatus Babeliales bacterium]|nr:30S ribosomal protein S1 [Candidatus Babeliales bacterium]